MALPRTLFTLPSTTGSASTSVVIGISNMVTNSHLYRICHTSFWLLSLRAGGPVTLCVGDLEMRWYVRRRQEEHSPEL